MRLKQIEYFVAVVEAGSIHAAARKIGVSQPAVTKTLRSLEVELCTVLIRRTSHGTLPTPAGKAFFARVQVAHTELRKAQEEVLQLTDGGGGSVAFGVGPTAAVVVVPDAIVQFRKQHPRIPIRILEGVGNVVLPLVRNETLDFAIAPRPVGTMDPALAFRPMFRHQAVVVARKAHPLVNASSLAQLAGLDWIHLFPVGGPRGILEEAFSSIGVAAPKPLIQCESFNIMAALLEKTDMIGICSHRLATSPYAQGALKRIQVEPLPTYTVGLFTRRDPSLTPVAAALARAIVASARRQPPVH